MKLQDPVATSLRKGNIIMRHRGGINSHRLTTQCCHAPTFYTRPILPLRHGFMYFVLLHALLLEHRRLPSRTCFHIILIWWLSGLPFDLWLHANDAWNTNFISKMSWSPPVHIESDDVGWQLWWRSSRCMRWWNRSQYYKETPSQQGKCYRFYYFPT